MQVLGLEYLRFADGLEKSSRRDRAEEFRQELLLSIVKASLVASGDYKEDVLFSDYFSGADSDDEVDFTDNSGVDFEAPSESDMDILARMLADDTVLVDGAPLEGPDAEQVPSPEGEEPPSLPPPRDFDPTQVEQDTEWV